MIRLRAPESKPDGRRAPFRAPQGAGGRRGVPRRRGLAPSEAMASTERVCPYCGEPPGPGVFCAACGRNLAAVERLPTRAEWEADATAVLAPAAGPVAARGARARRRPRRPARSSTRCARPATPGRRSCRCPTPPRRASCAARRRWRDGSCGRSSGTTATTPGTTSPGSSSTTGGTYHRIDSQIRGWGQRNFPVFYDTAARRRARPAGRRPARRRPRRRAARARRRRSALEALQAAARRRVVEVQHEARRRDLVVLARRGHRRADREVLDDVRAPAVVALGQRDPDDPLGLERLRPRPACAPSRARGRRRAPA